MLTPQTWLAKIKAKKKRFYSSVASSLGDKQNTVRPTGCRNKKGGLFNAQLKLLRIFFHRGPETPVKGSLPSVCFT